MMKTSSWLALPFAVASAAFAQVIDYRVAGDGIPQALTSAPGNALRGRELIARREAANCLQCHSIKGMPSGGSRGPALDGVGASLTSAQLRLSVVDYSRMNPKVAMPSFHKAGVRSGAAGEGHDTPILAAQEVEDVVAYLSTLKK